MSLRRVMLVPFLVAALAVACHPGTEEARKLRDSCEAGDAKACNEFAVRLREGRHVLRDAARATELFDSACVKGVGQSCVSLGDMLQRGIPGVKTDSARALALFTRGCDKGAMEGCARLGVAYRDGVGLPRDVARAVALFRQAKVIGGLYRSLGQEGESVAAA